MLHPDDRFSDAVEACVRDLEQHTDAELVVVAARRSHSYRDVSLLIAGVGALLTLVAVLYAPVVVPPFMVPIDVVIGGAIAYGIGRSPWLLGYLVPRSRRRHHTESAARGEFVVEAVHATPQRSGVLVYVSALEGCVVVVPDVGIEGLVTQADWVRATQAMRATDTESFVEGLKTLGAVLEKAVPHVDRDDRVALSDAPRIRS